MPAHFFSLVAVIATFALLILGGVVHGTGSSLACPDWPTCYGEWMPEMTGGILYEHSHRLLGTVVGLLTIGVAVTLHLQRASAPRLARLGWLALAVVVFQGVLGGVTVMLRLPTAVSTAHLATAMAFFCLLAYLAWETRPSLVIPRLEDSRWRAPARVALALCYVQIVLGALVRHTGAGLACPDLPLCHGQVWPSPDVAVIPGAAHLHVTHRFMGVIVAVVLVALAVSVARGAASPSARRLAWAILVLVPVQVTLGVLSVTSLLGLFEVTSHLGVGALLLTAVFLLNVALPAARHRAERVARLEEATA